MRLNISTYHEFRLKDKIRFVLFARCHECKHLVLFERMLVETVKDWDYLDWYFSISYTCTDCGSKDNDILKKFFAVWGKDPDYYLKGAASRYTHTEGF